MEKQDKARLPTFLARLFRRKEAHEEAPLEYDFDGSPLYREQIIGKILDELNRRKGERGLLEQQWTLNANFLVGNQYCDINPFRGDIEQLTPVYDWLEHEAFNNIAPLIETRIANLKKLNFLMKVNPRTNELDDFAKADVSTKLLQYIQKTTDFETKRNTLISWNELCGNCFWLSWWDPSLGAKVAEETVITEQNGEPHQETVGYYEGGLNYGLVTPYEVYPESLFKQGIESQSSIILEQVKTVEEIFDLYGIKLPGESVDTFTLTPLPSGGGFGYEATCMTIGHQTVEGAAKLITYFEKPSRHRPNGVMAIIAGGELLFYGDLPYRQIPLVQTVCREVPGQFFGKSVIEDLIPRQRAYNSCLNRIHEYIKRIAIGSYIVQDGAVDIEEYEQNGQAPGAFLTYRAGFNPPVPIPNGQLPGEIMQERYNLKADMEYVAGTSQLMVNSALPSGVTSGAAINSLQEIDNTRLSLTGDMLRTAIKKLAVQWLEILKRYAVTRRVINCTGLNNFGDALIWSKEDINSFDVEYTTANELEYSEEAQRQNFEKAYAMGLFTDSTGTVPERVRKQIIEKMKIGDYTDLMSMPELQMQAASREDALFEQGVIPKISAFDDHGIHYETHLRYLLQMRFRLLQMKKPELAKAYEDHVMAHKTAMAQEGAQAMMAQMAQMKKQ